MSSRGQQKHLVREKIIGVSGVCASDRAAPPPPPAACVCRDGGESPAGGGQRSRGSDPRHPFLGAAGARTVWDRCPPPPEGQSDKTRPGAAGAALRGVPRTFRAATRPSLPLRQLYGQRCVSAEREKSSSAAPCCEWLLPCLTRRAAGRARGRAQFWLSTPPGPEVRFPGSGGRTGSELRDSRPRPAVVFRPAAFPGPPRRSRPVWLPGPGSLCSRDPLARG